MEEEELVILLLEDNSADVFLIREALALEKIPFELVHFQEGESAIRFISSKNGKVPDLAILDLNVPNRDGREVLQHIRADSEWGTIPVVFLSSSPKDAARGSLDTADGYIEKPGSLEAFLAIGKDIVECCRKARARRSQIQSALGGK